MLIPWSDTYMDDSVVCDEKTSFLLNLLLLPAKLLRINHNWPSRPIMLTPWCDTYMDNVVVCDGKSSRYQCLKIDINFGVDPSLSKLLS